MEDIRVITGVRYYPEQLIERLSKKKHLKHISYRYVSNLYSPSWVFEFRVKLHASKSVTNYAGYYAGVDEINMTPGKIQILPAWEEIAVESQQLLPKKLIETRAVDMAWAYSKRWITIKYKHLFAPPTLEDHRTHQLYKTMYLIEFYNHEAEERKYMVLDSLTGDLEPLHRNLTTKG